MFRTGFTFFFDNNASTSFTGNSEAKRPVGGVGNDFLNVGTGLDAFGEQGNDFINGNDVANRISGGLGDDQIFAGLGNDFVWGDAGDDFLEGNAGNDVVFGGFGDDRLSGLQDNDTLVGGEGADELNGGDGIDAAAYAQSRNGVSVDLATNTGLGGDASGDTFFSIENVTGSQIADIVSGDTGANTLKGLGGNDLWPAAVVPTPSMAAPIATPLPTRTALPASPSTSRPALPLAATRRATS